MNKPRTVISATANKSRLTTLAPLMTGVGGEFSVNLNNIPSEVNKIIYATHLHIESHKAGNFDSQAEWKLLIVRLKRLAHEIEATMIEPN